MPEYHLPVNGPVISPSGATVGYYELDDFTKGYIAAMFFTEHSPAFSFADIEEDREAWLEAERKGIDYDDASAGHDFWFTRSGHGAGFWDRGLGVIGDKLSDASGRREVDVYLADDGKVYVS